MTLGEELFEFWLKKHRNWRRRGFARLKRSRRSATFRSHCTRNKMLQSTSRKGRRDSFVGHATGDPRLRPKIAFSTTNHSPSGIYCLVQKLLIQDLLLNDSKSRAKAKSGIRAAPVCIIAVEHTIDLSPNKKFSFLYFHVRRWGFSKRKARRQKSAKPRTRFEEKRLSAGCRLKEKVERSAKKRKNVGNNAAVKQIEA